MTIRKGETDIFVAGVAIYLFRAEGIPNWSAMDREEETDAAMKWSRVVSRVFQIIAPRLPQRDVFSLLLVSRWCYRTLVSDYSLWQDLDLREKSNSGEKLIYALSQVFKRQKISLEFAQDVEDGHLCLLRNMKLKSLEGLEFLNLNGCQKISDSGIEAITSACPFLKVLSVYWNVRITDLGVSHIVKNCKQIINLNLSGCKNISDRSLYLIADNYKDLKELNLTRCVKLTDGGLQQIIMKCSSLQSLNLYALSHFTNDVYTNFSYLASLKHLDLCGSQNLLDEGLFSVAQCKSLLSLNLTWCVRVTDIGVVAIAEGCAFLEYLSLFGIVGVTDKCIESLSKSCSRTLTTLDVNGCIGIKRRSRDELLQLFPNLKCFKVHS